MLILRSFKSSRKLAFLEDAEREPWAQCRAIVHERAEPEEREGIADVDGDRDTVDYVQRRAAAPSRDPSTKGDDS